MGDIVAGLDPGPVRGRPAGRRDHLHRPVLERHREAEAAIIALGRRHQRAEVARIEIGGMGIEAREHAVDRALDQPLVVDLVDIFAAHPLEHVHELLELAIGRGAVLAPADLGDRRGGRDQSDGAQKSELAGDLYRHGYPGIFGFGHASTRNLGGRKATFDERRFSRAEGRSAPPGRRGGARCRCVARRPPRGRCGRRDARAGLRRPRSRRGW